MNKIGAVSILMSALSSPAGSLGAAEAVVTSTSAIITEASVAPPAYLGTYQDPGFKTSITRISDFNRTAGGVTWGNRVRHHYSKTQAWNADMSLLLLHNDTDMGATIARTPRYLILDGGDYRFLFGLDFAPYEYRWHPTNPDILYYTFQNRMASYNVRTKQHTLIRQFDEYPAVNGAITLLYEGNVSHDGNWIVLISAVGSNYEVYPLDLRSGEKHRVLTVPKTLPNGIDLDWASISPSGNYVVLQWDDTLTEVYTRDLVKVRNLPTNISHYDMALEDGIDIAAGVRKPSAPGEPSGAVVKVPLAAGAATVINSRGYASHTSARNLRRPGWVFSSYSTTWSETSWAPYHSELVAIKTDGSGAVQRLAHFRNTRADYYTESQPTASPDGLRVIFASNWNGPASGRPIGDYVVDARDLLPFVTSAAYRPVPTDGSRTVSPLSRGILAWSAGLEAAAHRVYFSTNSGEVSSRSAAALLGTSAGAFKEPGPLLPHTTYYWAVDEISAAGAVAAGPLWSFTTNRGETAPLFFDSFEDASLTGQGWTVSDSNFASQVTLPERGGRVVRLRSGASIVHAVDARGYGDIHVKYAMSAGSTGGQLVVEWSADGVAWNALEAPGATEWQNRDLACRAGAAGQESLRVRFRAVGSGDVFIDGVTIDGVPFAASADSRLANLSVRANLLAGRALTAGLVMQGGSKPVLVRAIGPGLAPYLPGMVLAGEPRLELRDGAAVLVQANAGWGGAAALAGAFTATGAFPLAAESRDAALLRSIEGLHTAEFHPASAGVGLLEVYDAGAGISTRLVNLSARYHVGSGAAALVAGLVIDGAGAKTVLIRGIGPGLGKFGLTGVLADPKLEIFEGASAKIAENDNWSPGLAATFEQVGAFSLTGGSKDAALVVTLSAGVYSARLSGADGGTGEGIVEVYEVPR